MYPHCVYVKHRIALCGIKVNDTVGVVAWCVSRHLCGRVSVSIPVSRHLPGPPHIVVANGFPPNAGCGLLKPLHALINFLSQELLRPADNRINTTSCWYSEALHEIFDGGMVNGPHLRGAFLAPFCNPKVPLIYPSTHTFTQQWGLLPYKALPTPMGAIMGINWVSCARTQQKTRRERIWTASLLN